MIEPTYYVYLHLRKDTGEVFYVGKGTRTPMKQYIRANTISRRNIYWNRIAAKCGGFVVHLVADFYAEEDAFAMEKALIAEYGRQRDGGCLSNLTEGGEGHAGLSPTEQTRKKMSERHRGKPKPEHVRIAVSNAQRGVPNPPEQNRAHALRMTGAGNPNFGTKNSPETIAKRVATRGKKCSGSDHPFFGTKRPQHVIDILREKQSKKVIDRATGHIYSSTKEAAAAVGKSSASLSRWLRGVRPNPTTLEFA